ncbi:GNAT family N-acetyltransferase [Massilia eurypsychrophila]|nr:GNAT family N-acetyltransferase [Massilia eurypsychrophila]
MTTIPPLAGPMAPHATGVEVVRSPDLLAADVRAFLDDAETRCVEFGLAWFSNLAATVYPGSDELRFYVLRRHGAVLAVLPLRAERARLGWTLHAFGNFYTTQFEPLFAPRCCAADLVPLMAAMQSDFPGLSALRLAPMDPTGQPFQLVIEAMRLAGWRPFDFFCFGNWYQPVDGSWIAYLAQRSGTLRSTIKRMTKKFGGDGGTLEIVTGSADVARAIDAYNLVYASSWKQAEPYPEFMPGLARTCAGNGSLRLGLAWLNGKPIAAQLWIVAHGRAEIYKVAYDEGFKAYAPGTLLTALLMEHAIEVDKVIEVDYLIGDDPYKKTWMSHRRERWGIIAYNPRSVGGLAGWAREVLGRRVKALRARLKAVSAPA